MAKKKATSARPTGPPIVWAKKVRRSIVFSQYLICNQIKIYFEDPHPESVFAMIAYIGALRASIERFPLWPRHENLDAFVFGKWSEKVVSELDRAAKSVPVNYRDEFKSAVVEDIDYIAAFMYRERDLNCDV